MHRLRTDDKQDTTVSLTRANYEWLRDKAHRERKSQALVLNEVLADARAVDAAGREIQAWFAEQDKEKGEGGDA